MTRTGLRGLKRSRRRDAFTLTEAVVSMVVVSVMLVAALNTVGAAKLGVQKTGDRGKGTLLAQQLMSEILRQDYADADYGPDSFGRSAAETAPGNRSLYDDVDDYDGWNAEPPQYKDGTVMGDLQGWRRSVEVDWVDPQDISQTVADNQGVKRITVTVVHDDVLVAELTAIRTLARDNMENR